MVKAFRDYTKLARKDASLIESSKQDLKNDEERNQKDMDDYQRIFGEDKAKELGL